MPTLLSFVTGWIPVALLMLGLHLVHLRTKNAAIVDAGWALSLPILALWHVWRPVVGVAGLVARVGRR